MTSLGLLELQLHHKTSPQKDSLVRRFHWFGEIFKFTPILGQWSILFGPPTNMAVKAVITQLHKHNGPPNCTNDLIKISWCSFRVDLTPLIKETIPAWLLNQKLTPRLSMNLVTAQSISVQGLPGWLNMIEADWATLRHNLMVCCVNFEAPWLTSELCCCGTRFRMMTWNKPSVKAGNDRSVQKNYQYILWFRRLCFCNIHERFQTFLTTFATYHHSLIPCLEKGINTNSRCSLHLERTSHQRQAWHQEHRQRPQKTIGI